MMLSSISCDATVSASVKTLRTSTQLILVYCCKQTPRKDITNVHAADIRLLLPQTQSEDITNVHATDIGLLLPQTRRDDTANVNAAAIYLLLPQATVKMVYTTALLTSICCCCCFRGGRRRVGSIVCP